MIAARAGSRAPPTRRARAGRRARLRSGCGVSPAPGRRGSGRRRETGVDPLSNRRAGPAPDVLPRLGTCRKRSATAARPGRAKARIRPGHEPSPGASSSPDPHCRRMSLLAAACASRIRPPCIAAPAPDSLRPSLAARTGCASENDHLAKPTTGGVVLNAR